ncbi:hypothetical protein K431DRAFT_287053 [Polychaeton citri CBS 116435]|uniref:DUF4385 domain containing protein n=1 Tax=Polychaeton citri CBS 116435 TaxID=1314669 RepID=A0A9P4UKG6_9PEZI|nr:hypothetical protein K431DRAFT_287053 [Polychaeton citri CBS 116435]
MPRSRKQDVAVKREDKQQNADPALLPTPASDDESLRMSYRVARGEQGVLTFEPYKSILLPYWRFRTVPIAKQSSEELWTAFGSYVIREDFVGADMARKFIQMGMTRAKRYANHKGGKKYNRSEREVEEDPEGEKRKELPRSNDHKGQEEKLEASEIFKQVWKRATTDKKYLDLKENFLREQKTWEKQQKKVKKEEEEVGVKTEHSGDADSP